MADGTKITPAQLMQLANKLRKSQATAQEADQIDQLAQKGLSDEQQAQIHSVMQNKEELNRLLQRPEAQALLKKLGGKGQ